MEWKQSASFDFENWAVFFKFYQKNKKGLDRID